MKSSVSDIIKKVRQIEINAWRKSQNKLLGNYHSHLKGQGMTFSEVRPYTYGDEIRRMDWNKTARFREPFVKVMEEEREMNVLFVVDVSKSMEYGSRTAYKIETGVEIAAAIGLSGVKNGDKIGLIQYDNGIRNYLPPKKGMSHFLAVLSKMLQGPFTNIPAEQDKVPAIMQNLSPRNSYIIWISDFAQIPDSKSIGILAKKNNLVAIHLQDEKEISIPKIGWVHFRDSETGELTFCNTSSSQFKSGYEEKMNNHREQVESRFSSANAKHVRVNSGEDFYPKLYQIFT